jgi:hypothetical protein
MKKHQITNFSVEYGVDPLIINLRSLIKINMFLVAVCGVHGQQPMFMLHCEPN